MRVVGFSTVTSLGFAMLIIISCSKKSPDQVAWETVIKPTGKTHSAKEAATIVLPQKIAAAEQFEKEFPQSPLIEDSLALRVQAALFIAEETSSENPIVRRVMSEIDNRQNLPPGVAVHLGSRDLRRAYLDSPSSTTLLEQIADDFGKKYPGTPESEKLYLAAAQMMQQSGDLARSTVIVQRLAESSNLEVRERATGILKTLAGTWEFPELKLTTLDGRQIDTNDYRGKVLLVDFWATWCGPCIALFPEMKAVYEKYHDRGFEIIGINMDEDRQKVMTTIEKFDLPWPQHFDGKGVKNEIAVKYGVVGIPVTCLIDRSGKVHVVDIHGRLESLVAKMLDN